MQPRRPESKKWTAFPKELLQQIEQIIAQNFKKELKGAKIFVDGRIYSKEILFSVGFLQKGRLAQNNFECSIDFISTGKMKVTDAVNLCVDAAAAMMAQYFEQEEEDDDFPRQWTSVPFEGTTVYLQYHRENSELEEEADRILGLPKKDALFHDEDSDDDIDVDEDEEKDEKED